MSTFDQRHIWHPYTSLLNPLPCYQVNSAKGVFLMLSDGKPVIDAMSSWWCAIHGYNHPKLNEAMTSQLGKMSHVMFGGITHEPAIQLAKQLIDITPPSLDRVFFADSGSVAVEVAMKMALQFFAAQGLEKSRFLTVKGGYHGDTLGAMSVCDPINGMHTMFGRYVPKQLFVETPLSGYSQSIEQYDFESIENTIASNAKDLAALIIEPIVQGAGGMRFHSPAYLERLVQIARSHGLLIIFDEIATGFGRTGKWFATNHTNLEPDIMCVGKALTGGYMSLAATLCSEKVSDGIAQDGSGVLMHGPTFMANPLACSVACASLSLLQSENYLPRIAEIEALLTQKLNYLKDSHHVADVRVLGAIGVVEMKAPVDVAKAQAYWVKRGVWIRPFGKLIYIMPPYIITDEQLTLVCQAIGDYIAQL